MAITLTAIVTIASQKSSSNQIIVTPNNDTASVGSVLVVVIAKDNLSTTDGETSEVIGITDTIGNSYVKAAEFCNSQGAAAAGATVAVWFGRMVTAFDVGQSMTIQFSGAITACAVLSHEITVGTGNTLAVESYTTLANDGADPGSMDLTVPAIEHLWLRANAHERPGTDTWTQTAGYTADAIWTGTTGNPVASNMTAAVEYDISSATTNASDPAWNNVGDEAAILITFKEVSANTNPGNWIGKGGWV